MVAKEFSENVRSGDVMTVRSALIDSLICDRTFRTFDEALQYASSQLPVIEEHDGKAFEPKSAWNRRYLNLQKAELSSNFSQARIDHLKDVIKAVMPAEESDVTSSAPSTYVPIKEKTTGGRTGRRAVEETVCQPRQPASCQEQPQIERRTNPSGKTGRRVVSETEYPTDDQRGQKSTQGFDGASALIVGGVAVATAGLFITDPIIIGAVAVTKPMVIGAGAVTAGVGGIMKASKRK